MYFILRILLVSLQQAFPEKYDRYIVKKENGQLKLKDEYKYLDSVNIYGYNYSSMIIFKIRGFLIEPRIKGNYPVIIFNRGGNKDNGLVSLQTMTDFLSKIAVKGYIIIGSQLRGNRAKVKEMMSLEEKILEMF